MHEIGRKWNHFEFIEFQEFTRKQGVSVAKTSIHILFDAVGSQVCL